MADTRYQIETDSLGRVKVPAGALYSAQTQRAVENFRSSGLKMPTRFIKAVTLIKKAAAEVNRELGLINGTVGYAISAAADEILAGKHLKQFPVDVFQTGSGTSTNMNVNEVLAALACQRCDGVDPNDQVNMGQSSNDVIPTAIHLSAAIAIDQELLPAMNHLAEVIDDKARDVDDICKTGRTHLMDAMPIRLSQEMRGWSAQIRNGVDRIQCTRTRLHKISQGATAVGTGINTPPEFAGKMAERLSEYTGLKFTPNPSPITIAGQSGNFQLNIMLPVIAFNLLQSIDLLSITSRQLADKAISGFRVNEDKLKKSLLNNPVLITVLSPHVGYRKVAEIVQRASKERRPVIEVAEEETQFTRSELEEMLDPIKATQGGIRN